MDVNRIVSRYIKMASISKKSNFIEYSPTSKSDTEKNEKSLNDSSRFFVRGVMRIIRTITTDEMDLLNAYSVLVSMAPIVKNHRSEEEVAEHIMGSKANGFKIYFEDEKGNFGEYSDKTREKIRDIKESNTTWIRFLEMVASLNKPGDTRKSERFIKMVEDFMRENGIVSVSKSKAKKQIDDSSKTMPVRDTEWETVDIPYKMELDDVVMTNIQMIRMLDLERIYNMAKNERIIKDQQKQLEKIYPKAKPEDKTIQ